MGTDDYIRPIYPEDDMEIAGDIVMYRFYPDYTSRRVAMGLSHPIPTEHRPMFFQGLDGVDPVEAMDPNSMKKGNPVTVGLWMFSTDSREPLKDVMLRYVLPSAHGIILRLRGPRTMSDGDGLQAARVCQGGPAVPGRVQIRARSSASAQPALAHPKPDLHATAHPRSVRAPAFSSLTLILTAHTLSYL